jgi:S1-C subfamily serine protease
MRPLRQRCLLCLASTLAGAVAALAAAHWLESSQIAAQDFPSSARPRRDVARRPVDEPAGALAGDYTPDERTNIAVYEAANRSVVNINTMSRSESLWVFAVYTEGAGSGLVLDRQGHILTASHVVDGAKAILVTLFDGQQFEAQLVGVDRSSDLAVLRIEAPEEALFPVPLGTSHDLLVGQRVFAIGNPFGLDRTLTTGIISSLNRTLPSRNDRTIRNVIQIDAAINPGNSGGPLLDSHARLIGINTAIASATGQNAGVGFAIPAGTIARVVPQLIATGRVVRPDCGIVQVFKTERGLLIATLQPGGPAERAGLRGPRLVRQKTKSGPFAAEKVSLDLESADLILAVDGVPIKTVDDFLTEIETRQVGQEVMITILRGGQELHVPLRLVEGE